MPGPPKPNRGAKGGGIEVKRFLDLLTRWAALFGAVLAALGVLGGFLFGLYMWGQRAGAYFFVGAAAAAFAAGKLFGWAFRPPPHRY